MISKREWVAALRRVMKGVALMVGGASLMAAVVYLSIGLVAEAADERGDARLWGAVMEKNIEYLREEVRQAILRLTDEEIIEVFQKFREEIEHARRN